MEFLFARGALVSKFPESLDLLVRFRAGLSDQSLRQLVGLFMKPWIIEQQESLGGGGRDVSNGCRRGAVREIERFEERDFEGSLDDQINAAAVLELLGAFEPHRDRDWVGSVFDFLAQRGVDAWTGTHGVERSVDRQDRVADRFGVEASELGLVVARCIRVDRRPRAFAERLGAQDDTMKMFDRPTRSDKFTSKIIEQKWIGRWQAGVSEIIGCRNDSDPEVSLPNAVDQDASRQRILGVRDPAGEFQTVGSIRFESRVWLFTEG